MAVLTDPERLGLAATFMRDNTDRLGAVRKADIRAAVNAIDDYFNTNAAAINNALPAAAKAELTVAQKARIITLVIRKRYLNGGA